MQNILSDTSLTKAIDQSHLHHVTKYDSDDTMADTSTSSEETQMIMYNECFLFLLYSQVYFNYSTSMDSCTS